MTPYMERLAATPPPYVGRHRGQYEEMTDRIRKNGHQVRAKHSSDRLSTTALVLR